eukprot:CAMPEP_0171333162 /NCGR_PEP_ID=MMETSP0878-20121228/3849_1 /TAXON_ID=67004 /ORGANISM="Thalassiosira weissflogii, Strain CCMP1336" /LENGTH=348 /DNA_ID=CAMNT_0011834073 /DNA_START=66 /DNA_END=1109 /DNA_ORIENTATION=+
MASPVHHGTMEFHRWVSNIFLVSSLPTYTITRFVIVAPFGRHVPTSSSPNGINYRWWYGPTLPAHFSWFLFECPNLLWSIYCYFQCYDADILFLNLFDDESASQYSNENENIGAIFVQRKDSISISKNLVLLLLFTLHYFNRAVIYPMRMNSNSHEVPLIVIISAMTVTTVNGYLQCFYLCKGVSLGELTVGVGLDGYTRNNRSTASGKSWGGNLLSWLGIVTFFTGMGINLHSDGVLRKLRRYGPSMKPTTQLKNYGNSFGAALINSNGGNFTTSKPYYIPHTPFFRYVSCPNFAGEILEWFGFAMASEFSYPSVAFLVYTAANLIPRGVAHLEWYLRKFDNYPKER